MDVEIIFNSPFDNIPSVVVSGGHSGKAGISGAVLVSTTAKGFVVRLYNSSPSAGNIVYRWIATSYKS